MLHFKLIKLADYYKKVEEIFFENNLSRTKFAFNRGFAKIEFTSLSIIIVSVWQSNDYKFFGHNKAPFEHLKNLAKVS